MARKPRAEKAVENTSDKVVVIYRGNRERVYTKEIHGDDFLELAKSFADKFNGKIQ